MNFAAWLKTALSNSPDASFGRFAALLTLVFCLGWDTAYVVFVAVHFSVLHFTAHDLLPSVEALLGQGGFCTLFYGGGKALNTLGRSNDAPERKG